MNRLLQKANSMNFPKAILGLFVHQTWKRIKLFHKHERSLWLDLREPEVVDRYLYNFINQLNAKETTHVVLPISFNMLKSIFEGRAWRKYRRMLLNTDLLYFQLSFAKKTKWKRVSTSYFNTSSLNENRIRIPIGPHPIAFNAFKSNFSKFENRTQLVVFAGNVNEEYNSFDSNTWKMPNRRETAEYLWAQGHQKIFHTGLSKERYIELLNNSKFFLALPGLYMPFSHNLYEAIFAGCIPIIHDNYRILLEEPLKSVLQLFSWRNNEELIQLLASIETHNWKKNYGGQKETLNILAKYKYDYYNSLWTDLRDKEEICFCAGIQSYADYVLNEGAEVILIEE